MVCAADGEEGLAVARPPDVGDVRRVPVVLAELRTPLRRRETEKLNQPEIVAFIQG